jgi:hypothetical protein
LANFLKINNYFIRKLFIDNGIKINIEKKNKNYFYRFTFDEAIQIIEILKLRNFDLNLNYDIEDLKKIFL